MHTIHNARIQLLATLLNTMAGTCFTVGIAAPIAAVFFYSAAPAGLRLVSIVLGIVFWLAAAVMLHLAGRMVLGGLRQP
jgi:multisubunit Na+/H+ antiporter MnhG subunit